MRQPGGLDRVGDCHGPGRRPFAHVADRDRVRAGLPGRQRRRVCLADRQVGDEHARDSRCSRRPCWEPRSSRPGTRARRCSRSWRPRSKPAVATLTWKLTVALAPGASRPPAPGGRARAEAHHHLAAGESAEVVPARVGHGGSVEADAAGDEGGPRGDRVAERRRSRAVLARVLHRHRVRQRVAEVRGRAARRTSWR